MPKISNCIDQVGLVCNACDTRFTLNNNTCTYIIENCVTMSGTVCTACLDGYAVDENGQCVFRTINFDPNCNKYDEVSIVGNCLECSQGFFLNITQCLQVDPLCKTFNNQNGYCLSCYNGYKLNILNGKCEVATAD